ncbi:ptprf [Symbiodinium natans]|uniref:Ptprf protein n=1 Tax=Symbiodinium natans TaxID=878477 RepID=A0A812HW07_9DINO|nr:ptprf [Symbiodinium natans]
MLSGDCPCPSFLWPRLPRVVCESRACRGAAVPVVAGQDSPAWLWLDGNGLVRQLNDALRMYSVFAYVESYGALDNDGSMYGPLRFQVPATSNSFAVLPQISSPVTKDGFAVSFTPTASAGWGYAMLAAEADYATLTVANVKAFMSAVGDATCKWNDFAFTMGNTVNLTSCRLYGGQKYRLFVYLEDGHNKDDGVLADPIEVNVPPSNSFAGVYPYPRLGATPTVSQVTVEFEAAEAGGVAWAVVIPELDAMSATVATIKAATGALCSTASVSLTTGLQSFTVDNCALSLEVLYKAMVYIEDALAENDGSFAPVDVMVPSNGTTNAFAAYPQLVSIGGALASSDGVTFTVTASSADGRLWAMVVPDYVGDCMTVRAMKFLRDALCSRWNHAVNDQPQTLSVLGCNLKGGESYRLFVYVEGTYNGDDGVLAPAVQFMVPYTNTFLVQPAVANDLVSPDGFQLTFQAESEGAVWAMVVANIHEQWVDPNAIKVGTYSLGSAMCHLQGEAFAYVEGLNSSYTDGQSSQPVSVLVPAVSMRFKTDPFLAESVLTSRVAFKFTTEATDQGAAAVVPGAVWAMVVTELQAPQVTRWSLKSLMGTLAMGGPDCRIDGESTVGGAAVTSLSEVSAVLQDCQLRHGTTYELVVYVEDLGNRSDGTLLLTKVYTPPGISNGFTDLPMVVGNITGEQVSVQFAGISLLGKAWVVVVPASLVSRGTQRGSATASSVMRLPQESGTGAVGGPDCVVTAMDIDGNAVDLDNCSLAFSNDYAALVYVADIGMHDDGRARLRKTLEPAHTLTDSEANSFCGIHERLRKTGVTFATCKVNAVNASARSSTAAEIDAIKPMATEADAKWLLETMCKPSTKEVRLAALAALDKSPKSCMRRFVQDGGLRILEKWLRKSPAARYACLQVLQKLPVSLPDLRQANIMPSVAMIQRSEAEEANGKQALALLERWRSLVQCSDEPPFKRPRQDEAPVAAAAPAPKAAAKAAAPVADPRPQTHAQAQPPQPRTPPLSQLPAAKSEDIPPELKNVDPRIALVLMENPDLLEFLKKQPGIFQNMSPQSLAFHRRNLKNARESSLQSEDSRHRIGCSVTVSNLTEQTTEQDILAFFTAQELTPVKVDLPRESRRKRPCGTAFVVLPSQEQAQLTVSRLHGLELQGSCVSVEPVDGLGDEAQESHRVQWKDDDELWEVIMFPAEETVEELGLRIRKQDFASKTKMPGSSKGASFEAARRVEMAMERQHAPNALKSATTRISSLAAAPFRSPASNDFMVAPMLVGVPSTDGLTATFEASKPGNLWAAVVSEAAPTRKKGATLSVGVEAGQANAALVTVATAKSTQLWACAGDDRDGGDGTQRRETAVASMAPALRCAPSFGSCGSLPLLNSQQENKRMKLLRTLAVLLLLPTATFAQEDEDADAPPDFDELLGEIDENKDGKISWEEMFGSDADAPDEEGMPEDIKAKYQAVYKECDSDGDGLINREELPTLFNKLTLMEEEEGMHDEKVYIEDENLMGDGTLSMVDVPVPGSTTFTSAPAINGVPTTTGLTFDYTVAHDAGATIGLIWASVGTPAAAAALDLVSVKAQKGRKESEKPLREASLFLAFSIALLRDRYHLVVYVESSGNTGTLASPVPFTARCRAEVPTSNSFYFALASACVDILFAVHQAGKAWGVVVEQANVASVTVGTIKAGTGQGPSPKRRTDPRSAYGGVCLVADQAVRWPCSRDVPALHIPPQVVSSQVMATTYKAFVYVEDGSGLGDGTLSGAVDVVLPASNMFQIEPYEFRTPFPTAISYFFAPVSDGKAWAILTSNMASRTPAEIKALYMASGGATCNVQSMDVQANVESEIGNFTCALTASQTYKLHVYVEDANGNNDGTVTTLIANVAPTTAPNYFQESPRLVSSLTGSGFDVSYRIANPGRIHAIVTAQGAAVSVSSLLSGTDAIGDMSCSFLPEDGVAQNVTTLQTLNFTGCGMLGGASYELWVYVDDMPGGVWPTGAAATDGVLFGPLLLSIPFSNRLADPPQIVLVSGSTVTVEINTTAALGYGWLTVYPTATTVDVPAARNVSNALCGVAAVQIDSTTTAELSTTACELVGGVQYQVAILVEDRDDFNDGELTVRTSALSSSGGLHGFTS